MLKFFRIDLLTGERKELTYEEALGIVLGTYRDNDMSRDMLTLPNLIKCRYSHIEVMDYKGKKDVTVLAAKMYNRLPMQYRYDENGNRR